MTIHLQPDMRIADLNHVFSAQYPFLKLEFFTRPHHTFEGSPAQWLIHDREKTLAAINPHITAGELPVSPTLLVRDVEHLLEEKFGLHAQVFRKSHLNWLATSATDNLSLAEQNERGQTAEHPAESISEPIDYREQD